MQCESLERLLGLSFVIVLAIVLLIFQNHSELLYTQRGVKLISSLVACCHDLKNKTEEVDSEKCPAMLVAREFWNLVFHQTTASILNQTDGGGLGHHQGGASFVYGDGDGDDVSSAACPSHSSLGHHHYHCNISCLIDLSLSYAQRAPMGQGGNVRRARDQNGEHRCQ